MTENIGEEEIGAIFAAPFKQHRGAGHGKHHLTSGSVRHGKSRRGGYPMAGRRRSYFGSVKTSKSKTVYGSSGSSAPTGGVGQKNRMADGSVTVDEGAHALDLGSPKRGNVKVLGGPPGTGYHPYFGAVWDYSPSSGVGNDAHANDGTQNRAVNGVLPYYLTENGWATPNRPHIPRNGSTAPATIHTLLSYGKSSAPNAAPFPTLALPAPSSHTYRRSA